MSFLGSVFGYGQTPGVGPMATTPAQAPGPNRGVLQWLKDTVGSWLGPRLSQDTREQQVVVSEKVRSFPSGIVFPLFLPYQDADYTHETMAMRLAYRKMLAVPAIKASLLSKIFSVGAQDLRIRPARRRDLRDNLIADFVRWNLTERLRDGVPGLIWSVLSGALVDGYSVCEPVWERETSGEWAGNVVLSAVKAKDVDHDVILQSDEYRNVVGVMGLRYNPGVTFAPGSLIIYRHMPWYDSPTGQSDLRAAYSSFWMWSTVRTLRGVGATNRAFPILKGTYQHASQKAGLENAMNNARSQSWFSIPEGVQVEALEWAGTAAEYFEPFEQKLEKEMISSIELAYLQAVEGQQGAERGNTSVHSKRSDLAKWWPSVMFQAMLNNTESGLIANLTRLNYASGRKPLATLSSIDASELLLDLQIDQGLLGMGISLSREATLDRYSREGARYPGDELKAMAPPPPPGKPGNPDAQGGDDEEDEDEDDSSGSGRFDEARVPAGSPEGGQWTSGGGGTRTVAKKDKDKDKHRDTWHNRGKTEEDTADVGYRVPDDERFVKKALKRCLKRAEIEDVPALVGAPGNATLTLSRAGGNGFRIEVAHPDYTATRYLRQDGNDDTWIKNDEFWMKPGAQGAGLGTEVFGRQVEAARALGVSYIKCHAAKANPKDPDAPHNGYYTWPRFGYDQKIEQFDLDDEDEAACYRGIKENFPEARSVLDVMLTREGRDWWKQNGTDLMEAKFDLADGSRSMEVFRAYQEERKAAGRERKKGAAKMAEEQGKGGRGIEEIRLSAAEEAALERAWERLEKEAAARGKIKQGDSEG